MHLLMMGTGPFAVPTFHALLDSRHTLVGLVTRPASSSRNRKAIHNPMLEAAQEAGVPIGMPEDINSSAGHEVISQFAPELLVVCDYGQILSRATLQLSRLGGINLHGSLLPRYRGAAPVNWALIQGEQVTGTSVIHMTARLDGGPLLTKCQTEIGENEEAQQLEQRLAQLGVAPVLEALAILEDWDGNSPIGESQPEDQASQARRLRKSDGRLDWTLSAVELHNRVRGLKPWPGTYTYWQRPGQESMRLIIAQTALCDQLMEQALLSSGEATRPGEVIACESEQLVVATGAGLLSLLEIQPAGRRAMQIDAFLRGYTVAVGDQLEK